MDKYEVRQTNLREASAYADVDNAHVYLASEADARISTLEDLLRRSWLKPASSEPDLEREVWKALGL